MTPGARIQAAIDVLTAIFDGHRPANEALADWGRSHRFAGSGDRAAIGNLVFDALRRRNSLAARFGDDSPRALALAVMAWMWQTPPDELAAMCQVKYGPGALSDHESAACGRELPQHAAPWVAGDYPDWLERAFERAFGERAAEEGAALAARAPLDLRTNLLKTSREKLSAALRRFKPEPTPFSPWGLRIQPPSKACRWPNLEADPAHGRGRFEVQDEGSQLAVVLADPRPGEQVLDLCSGSGGKSLAMAAAMDNKGQIYATDRDASRLRPIFERLKRAGARNVQVIGKAEEPNLREFQGRIDLVLVDAPCSGSGTWRRRPDAKWRLRPASLASRQAEQQEVLRTGAQLTKPGGRLIYVTCSVLPEENQDQIDAFLATREDFEQLPCMPDWRVGSSADRGLLLTPGRYGTDGFFFAQLRKRS